MARTRVGVVNSHPIQYFAPLYAYVSGDESLGVTALYCSDVSVRGGHDPGFGMTVRWDVELLSGYESVFLGRRAAQRTPGGFWSLVVPELWTEIRSGRYDVIWLHGYAYAAFVIAFLAAKSRGIPVLMRSETHLGLARASWRRRLRDLLLARAYRFVDAFLAIGAANRDYYRSLGVADGRIFDVPYTVDNARFIAESSVSQDRRNEIRQSFGIPSGVPVVLYASKLIGTKRPQDLLAAAARLRDAGHDCRLLVVGSGEMDAELRGLAAALGLDNVVFAGFVNQAELPAVLASADVFVLPSDYEPWGLIVNEAMCAGLPVVLSDKVGCAGDLVEHGVNGLQYPAGDAEALAVALAMLLSDAPLRTRMGRASRDRIRGWSYAECLRGLKAAVSSVHRGPAGVPAAESVLS
jgi:glycosyltransferase involved in cell wall biosynthesis